MQTASFQRTLQFRFSGQQPSHYRPSAKKIKSMVRLDRSVPGWAPWRFRCGCRHLTSYANLTKQQVFHDSSSGFPTKWRPSNENKIPYWWRVTTQIWVLLLIGWSKFLPRHNQSEALLWPRQWHVISMKFVPSFLRRHFAIKPVVGSRDVGCFIRLKMCKMCCICLKSLEKSTSCTALGVRRFFKSLTCISCIWDFKKPSPKYIYE